LIYLLLVAALIIFYLGEVVDGLIILAVLLFNAVVGTIQEGKAKNTLLALKKFVETNATVLRGGKEVIISDEEVVVGDIIILQEGEKVPTDARVILSHNLKIDQSALTGESVPVYKIAERIFEQNLPVVDQKNMVFKGTYIVSGSGEAIAVATGVKTEIGKISQEIAVLEKEVPLKANIRQLSRLIIIAVLSINSFLFLVGLLFGKPFKTMFTTAVALSVSIIPEGLPIVMTLILATGVWRMTKRNALVKRLQAVEALGQAKVIAVDKTGTITKNELVVQKVYTRGKFFEVGGVGYDPKGRVYLIPNANLRIDTNDANSEKRKARSEKVEVIDKQLISPLDFPELILAAKTAGFCANARVYFSEKENQYRLSGDPTEAALLVFSQKLGFQREIIEREQPILWESPFDYKTKFHAIVRQVNSERFLTVIGAPEAILKLVKLSKKERKGLELIFQQMSQEGLRVLAFAYNDKSADFLKIETMPKLTFGGFYGIKDSLRPEVKEAVRRSKEAGIKVVMITGDYWLTAKVIAKEAGIYQAGDEILTGQEIEEMTLKKLSQKLAKTTVFARVTPEHKLKIIQVYRQRGEIVAMTGDGVNDAPSLVAADLGVAMGKIGTEVAKEAADVVLLDDNFGSIISAIEEGRSIYKTIKKVILYLFSTSLGEVLTISIALFLGYPLPLLAGQIIWLNFVTDGFLDVALAMEPKERGLLRSQWQKSSRYLVDSLMVQRMLVMVLPMSVGTFFIFQKYLVFDLTKALTMSLTTLAIFQWFNAWNCRSENKSIFQLNPFTNIWLIGATLIVILLQLLAVYQPTLQKILQTTALTFSDWLVAFTVASLIIIIEEIRKFFYRNLRVV
jgi:Ca2+-transporting ATPase